MTCGCRWTPTTSRSIRPDGVGAAGTDAFLYDIRLTPESVARGLGPAAMDLAEQTACDRVAAILRVNVFTDDDATRALVEGRGFEPAATQMVLRLDGPRAEAGDSDARSRGRVESGR